MKKIIAAFVSLVVLFSASAMAIDSDFGWKPLTNKEGKVIGMSNRGERGGEVALTCNVQTHELNLTYNGGGKQYDLFVFRKFGVTDMNDNTRAGKFFIGMESTSQGDVYYNVLNADKAFVIARFPVGSRDILMKAVSSPDGKVPDIQQEGDEYFLTGSNWKSLIKDLSVNCPVNKDKDTPIF